MQASPTRICIIRLFLFFLQCYATHRDLHSFPTRRSSDLHTLGDPGDAAEGLARTQSRGELQQRPLAFPQRSEEHTSELQSRVDLVCRLLLEKKKKQPGDKQ